MSNVAVLERIPTTEELYREQRSPVLRVVDSVEVTAGVAGVAGAYYLRFVERPDDIAKLDDLAEQARAGECPPTECGIAVRDEMFHDEVQVTDNLGAIALLALGTALVLHKYGRPQRWFKQVTRQMRATQTD